MVGLDEALRPGAQAGVPGWRCEMRGCNLWIGNKEGAHPGTWLAMQCSKPTRAKRKMGKKHDTVREAWSCDDITRHIACQRRGVAQTQ